MRKKIIIIGCGFAGYAAAKELSRFKGEVEVTVIDRKPQFDFLPLLPDVIGRAINAQFLSYSTLELSKRLNFAFLNADVQGLDLDKREIFLGGGKTLDYDYVLIASGSETNFYGNNLIADNAYKLDDVNDALKITHSLCPGRFGTYIISGGGYTGVEIAGNLRIYLNKAGSGARIIIVEKAPSILGPLPEWVKAYVYVNLRSLGVEIFPNSIIDKVSQATVSIPGKGLFDNAMLIWAAGVKTADFIRDLKVDKNPQGRVKVDEYLRVRENCFIAGDASLFSQGNSFLRMAVQFALDQGACAAKNIINTIRNRRLNKYFPIDLGYLIPMANNRSCGIVMGGAVRGAYATFLHYLMCTYRSIGLKNKWGIIMNLRKGGNICTR